MNQPKQSQSNWQPFSNRLSPKLTMNQSVSNKKIAEFFTISDFAKSVNEQVEGFSFVFPCDELTVEKGQKIAICLELNTKAPYSKHVGVSLKFAALDKTKVISELKCKAEFHIVNYLGNKAQQSLLRNTVKNGKEIPFVEVTQKKYVDIRYLLDPSSGFLPGNELKFYCEVEVANVVLNEQKIKSNANQVKKLQSVEMEEFQQISVLKKEDIDVLFRIDRAQFNANKKLLASKSKIFKQLFTNNMSGFFMISDIDAKTFGAMLKFIETGNFEAVEEFEFAVKLMTASTKYQVTELKEKFEEWIMTQINQDTAVTVLKLGYACKSETLKLKAFEFIKNVPTIRETSEYQEMIQKNPKVLNDLNY